MSKHFALCLSVRAVISTALLCFFNKCSHTAMQDQSQSPAEEGLFPRPLGVGSWMEKWGEPAIRDAVIQAQLGIGKQENKA